jgi:hypothetical protein
MAVTLRFASFISLILSVYSLEIGEQFNLWAYGDGISKLPIFYSNGKLRST